MPSTKSLLWIVACCLAVCGTVAPSHAANRDPENLPNHRLVVLADMGNEPDEEQQMVHLLMYANEIDIEGLIAVTGKYLRTDPQPDLFHGLVDEYAFTEKALRQHDDGWPTAQQLRRTIAAGQKDYGIEGTGVGKSTAGSKLILEAAAKDDPRPLHVVVNAGANTFAQALIDYRNSHSAEQTAELIAKLRVFENGSQDNAGAWICHEFPDIQWIRSNYQTYCYGGPGSDGHPDNNHHLGPHVWEPYPYSPLGQHQWALEHIIADHGPLGRRFPIRMFHHGQLVYLEGGGTAPWMGLIQRGVYDPNHPHWGSFSGRFSAQKVKNYWSRHDDIRNDEKRYGEFYVYREAADSWTNPENGQTVENIYAPVWRWRRAMFNDFRSRMDWCVKSADQANHNPIASVDGNSLAQIVHRDVKPAQSVVFDAAQSMDPDGDEIRYRWWFYPEAGSYEGALPQQASTFASYTVDVPADAAGTELHLILEIADNNQECPLYDFRRIILNVAE